MSREATTNTSGLVGRARELAEIDAHFAAGARLVTLVGPPGAGKTRLAFEHASRSGVACFCELAGLHTRGELVDALRRGLARGAVSKGTDVEALLAELRTAGAVTVVLDDFDALVLEASRELAAWLEGNDVRLLVTSREALRIGPERRVEVGPLSVDEAVVLYTARALETVADARLDERAVRELVTKLDCLPLAVELGAARADVLDAQTLAARLEGGLGALRSRRRDASPRRSSVESALEASWELLSAEEKDVLCAASVVRGGFDLELLARIVDGDPSDALGRLIDRSLIRRIPRHQPARFALYESVRQFAADRWGAERALALRPRYVAAVLGRCEGWAEVLRRSTSPELLARLEAEHANLMEVATRATPAEVARAVLVLASLPSAAASWQHHVELLDRALASHADVTPERIELLLARASILWVLGPEAAFADLEAARADAARLGDVAAQVRALTSLGQAQRRSGRPDVALASARRAIELARTAGQSRLEAEASLGLGAHFVFTGEPEAAREPLDDALRAARRARDLRLEARALHVGAARAIACGALDEAWSSLEQARSLFQGLGDAQRVAIVERDLGTTAMLSGRHDEADALFASSEAGLLSVDAELGVAVTRVQRAIAALRRNDDAAARGWLDAVTEATQRLGDAGVECLAHTGLCWLHARAGRVVEARAALSRAEASASVSRDRRYVEALRFWRALVGVAEGRASGDPGPAVLAARALLAEARHPSDEVVIAVDALERMLDQAGAPRGIRATRSASVVQRAGGEVIDLRRRGPARRVLAALLRQRVEAPGVALDAGALVAAGWPGDRSSHDALLTRLYTMIRELRRLDLDDAIVTSGDGYLVDTHVAVTLDEG